MGIAGRGPKIKIQDVEERPKSHARSTSETDVASIGYVVADLPAVADWSLRAGNQRLPEGVTQGEPEETAGPKRWLRMIVPFVDAIWKR